jgi:hypothetical protein
MNVYTMWPNAIAVEDVTGTFSRQRDVWYVSPCVPLIL